MTVGIETWISHVQVLGGSQNWGTPISSLKIGTGLGCWGRPFLGTPQRSCITLIHYHFPITFHNIHTKKQDIPPNTHESLGLLIYTPFYCSFVMIIGTPRVSPVSLWDLGATSKKVSMEKTEKHPAKCYCKSVRKYETLGCWWSP
jgi:hypothetical protein